MSSVTCYVWDLLAERQVGAWRTDLGWRHGFKCRHRRFPSVAAGWKAILLIKIGLCFPVCKMGIALRAIRVLWEVNETACENHGTKENISTFPTFTLEKKYS